MNLSNYATGIQHVGIPTENLETTVQFYERLGFQIVFETSNPDTLQQVVFLQLETLVIEAYESDHTEKKTGAIDHIAINVHNIDNVYKYICRNDLNTTNDEIHFLPFWENGVKFFTIEGPNGEKIEFSQYL